MNNKSPVQLTFVDGWHPEEHDGHRSFRWMKREARLRLDAATAPGPKYLRLLAGHPFTDRELPRLSVSIGSGPAVTKIVEPFFSTYAFPVEDGEADTVHLSLDRIFQVPGDNRELGIMILQAELITPGGEIRLLDGWYDKDPGDKPGSPRWMKRTASILLPDLPASRNAFLRLDGVQFCRGSRDLTLTISSDAMPSLGRVALMPGEASYGFALPGSLRASALTLTLEGNFPPPSGDDPRTLGLKAGRLETVVPADDQPQPLTGWYTEEQDCYYTFRWMGREARMGLPRRALGRASYLWLRVASEMAHGMQRLSVSLDGKPMVELPLLCDWRWYSVPLDKSVLDGVCPPAGEESSGDEYLELQLSLNRLKRDPESPPGSPSKATDAARPGGVPGSPPGAASEMHPGTADVPGPGATGDPRRLGVKVAEVGTHDDPLRHEAAGRIYENALHNRREMLAGKTVLESHPVTLGIDLYGKCNIKPPCVYCTWDESKELEGDTVDAVVDEKTLEGYGPFYTLSRCLVNCSIGEPLLHPHLDRILGSISRTEKVVELATNGQAFNRRTIEALAGRRIKLNVSLDAASGKTYARIRNDRWESIMENLRLLTRKRREAGGLPWLFMVFMPMRVNRHELEDYFRLCRELRADALVLRPLNYSEAADVRVERGGYLFDYARELLSRDEQSEICGQCRVYAKRYGIPVINQFAFGEHDSEV